MPDQDQLGLFSDNSTPEQKRLSPLAETLRPKTLDEIIGHHNLIGPQSKLGQLLRQGHLPSLIVWGPPGSGKTTFALTLSRLFDARFRSINAIDSGAKLLRELGEEGRQQRQVYNTKTILFVDEIHRFNKSQQDVLLPFVEKGDLTLIGATTENPSYELNRALLSRARVLVFEKLQTTDLLQILNKIEEHYKTPVTHVLTPASQEFLLSYADGDARKLINSCELIYTFFLNQSSPSPLETQDLEQILQKSLANYDKNSDFHYDIISAFIKSVRGSDPDAAVYYLARMLEGGEDPLFIARRLIILASEDIGNADPKALPLAVSALQALEAIGMPEGRIPLAQVTTYLACCPKSNASYTAINQALEFVKQTKTQDIPLALRSARTDLAKQMGYGKGYQYPHDHPKGYVEQSYLPSSLNKQKFYEPTDRGFDKNLKAYLKWLKE